MAKTITNKFTMAQLQTAINDNNEIIFAAGTYNITKPLIIPSNRKITLAAGAILKRKANCSFFVTYHTAKTTQYDGAKNILITGDGCLYGVDSLNSYCNFVSLFHGSSIDIKNITILDTQGSHAIEINACNQVNINNVKFEGYRSNPEGTFREAIQLDFANATGLSLISDASAACYDLTCCNDITIDGCKFTASKYHAAPNTAIGTHTRPISGNKHKNIRILNNTAEGGEYNGHFASIINMDGVLIQGNKVSGYTRFARITALEKGYYANGSTAEKDTNLEEGISKHIVIARNEIINPSGSFACAGILCQGYGNKRHEDILVHSNTFETKSSSSATQYLNLAYTKDSVAVNNTITGKGLICKTYKTNTENAIVVE